MSTQLNSVGAPVKSPQIVGAEFDAFSRKRVSNPTTLLQSQSQYDMGLVDMFFHKTTTGGSLSHNSNQSSVAMATDATAGASAIRQTQRYIRYQPGKSQLIFVTFDFNSDTDGGTKRAGYFDDNNGVFLELASDGTLYVVRRSSASGSVVDTKISQSAWNVDIMDGNGISGFNLDISKSQILVIDLQWLAVGRIRIYFDIDGVLCPIHEFYWANFNSGVYMTTANLPVRWELSGNGNVTSLNAICVSVQSEGGFTSDLGHEFSTPSGNNGVTVSATERVLLSIRPKSTFNSIENRGQYQVDRATIFATGNPAIIRLYHGTSVTGGTWISADTESGIEYNVSATAFDDGHLTNSDYVAVGGGNSAAASGAENTNLIYLCLDIDGNNVKEGTFSVTAQSIGSGNASVFSNIHWSEIK